MSDTMDRTSLQDFIAANKLRMTATWTDSNPHMDGSDRMDHWRCTLMCDGRRMVVTFSKGSAHHGKPAELREVLSCMAGDAAGIENASSFTDWCGEYGYDTDSRKAEKIYRTCQRQRDSLLRLLGREAFEALLWRTEQE